MYVDTNHLQYVYLYTTLNNKIGCCNLLFTFYDESATYLIPADDDEKAPTIQSSPNNLHKASPSNLLLSRSCSNLKST